MSRPSQDGDDDDQMNCALHTGEMQTVAPRTPRYGSADGTLHETAHRAWCRRLRVGAGLALGCAVALLCLSVSGRPGAAELEGVLSLPVMGTGGGPTTPRVDDGLDVSKPVMGTGGGPVVHGIDSDWQNYTIDYNVFGLNVDKGSLNDADTPGALPEGRNEWENPFADFDFKPSDKHDGSFACCVFCVDACGMLLCFLLCV